MRYGYIWLTGLLYIAAHVILGKAFEGEWEWAGTIFMLGLTYFWYAERRDNDRKINNYKEFYTK